MQWPITAHDLAPGDEKSAELDLAPYDLNRIRSVDHPLFETAYGHLWKEFGAAHEMEERSVLADRFRLAPGMLYEMVLIQRDGEFVAVRDHTAAVARSGDHAVVHLSHNLVSLTTRRSGLAGWMRALPIATAHECLAHHQAPTGSRITLLAEMEYLTPEHPERLIRLKAYEKAGFRKIDPAQIRYHQPDFRPSADIDATGGPVPLAFQLLVRRVGREHERAMRGAEVRQLVETLYDIYRPQFRPADFAHPLLSMNAYPPDSAIVSLVPPTQC